MVAVYQLIFFLALGLLAIAVTVFVLAVSLLGRAIQMAIEAQDKAIKEQKEAEEQKIAEIQGKFNDATTKGIKPDIDKLGKDLRSLKWKKRINYWRLMWINTKPKLLGCKWGALVPAAFLLTSAIVSIMAIYVGAGTPKIFPYMWIAVGTLGVGICFVCLSLKVIEGVAKPSEKIAYKRDVEIFKTSLREFEEEKKPELDIIFSKETPPFHTAVDSELHIVYLVDLSKGEYAVDAEVTFFVPQGFSFPNMAEIIQETTHHIVPGYVTGSNKCEKTILSGARLTQEIVIKVPAKADKYNAYYATVCRGYRGPYRKFTIVVE